MLVVFEGPDRAGKSTQVRLLVECLESKGIPHKLFSYPLRKGTVTGSLIDEYLSRRVDLNPVSASLLLAANLYELKSRIDEAICKNEWVIFDRYSYSSIAYSAARVMLNAHIARVDLL